METNLSKQPGKPKSRTSSAAENLKKPGRSKGAISAAQSESPYMQSESAGQASMAGEGSAGKSDKGVLSKASKVAHRAADTVMNAASEQAHGVTRQLTGLLDDQVAHGADIVHELARTTRRAAEDLDSTSPHVAGLVRSAADRIDSYAGMLRDQTAEEMFETASDFTRRQPALVFGLAALAGFLAFRTFKAAPSGHQGSGYQGSSYRGSDYQSRHYPGVQGNA